MLQVEEYTAGGDLLPVLKILQKMTYYVPNILQKISCDREYEVMSLTSNTADNDL
jgi:hypothetical protein